MKRKIHSRTLVVLLSMLFIIGLTPVTALANTSTGIKVNGVDILNASNYTVECGEGIAVYDPVANMLTLDNATITRTDTQIPISFYNGDLTILLKGENTITTPTGGIVGYRGNVIFEGDGSLTITSSGLFGVYCDANAENSGHITVDGASLDIVTTSSQAQGLHALRTVSIKNNANVTLTGEGTNYFCIYAEGDISITDSTVIAKLNSADGGNTIVSYGSICIDHSVVNINTVANNIALAAINGLSISNSSQVTVESNGNASAVYTPQDLTISDSILKADSSQISVRNKGAMRIINSTVEAICNGDPITESLYSEDTISIEGNSNVLAIGKISAVNGVSVVPSSGTFIDVKVGMKENGEEGTSHFEASPCKEPTTLSGLSEYTYVHILNHAHIYDQNIVSDAYKASDATCTEPAIYYQSCVCGETGAETFISGTAKGHTLSKTESQEATCTEAGNKEYWSCAACGKYFSDADGKTEISLSDTVVAAKGHSYMDGKCSACSGIDNSFQAAIISGAGSTWQKSAKEGLSFTSNAAFEDFIKVQVDGKDIVTSNYEVKEGSTVITLKPSYLETLSVGKHTLAIVSNTGTATTEFSIKAASTTANVTQSAETSDNSNIALWVAVLLVAGAGLTTIVIYRRKRS